MPKKKPVPAAPPPAPTEKKKRTFLSAKARALAALTVAERAVSGDSGCTLAVQNAQELVARLPEGHRPAGEQNRGPLRPGDYAEPVPSRRHATEHRHLAAPYRLRDVYNRGRTIRCTAVDAEGSVVVGMLVSDLRRCAPPVAVPDVPQGDPAALGEDEPAAGDVVEVRP